MKTSSLGRDSNGEHQDDSKENYMAPKFNRMKNISVSRRNTETSKNLEEFKPLQGKKKFNFF